MTFGEFLGYILNKKNISIAKLANLTNTKSRNTIQRLLKDKSSIDVIKNFKKKLIMLDPLNLTPLEHTQLEESIEVSKTGKKSLLARNTLLYLFEKKQVVSTLNSNHIYGLQITNQFSLKQLFLNYTNYSSVKILIINAASIALTDAMFSFIQTSTNNDISIEHILYLGDNVNEDATTFVSIYKLITYTNYKAYYSSSPKLQNLSKHNISVMPNTIIVLKVLDDGTSSTDLIKFNYNIGFNLLFNNPGDFLYNFYLDCFEKIKTNCQNIRKTFEANTLIDKLIELCEYLLYLEKSTAEYLIKQNMCFQMIHIDILYKMLVDSNFLGLSEDHPKIQKLVQVAQNRFNNYFSTNNLKINIFTKRGLKDFVKNRILTDHLYCFREFTKEEVKFTLKFILNQIEENEFFKLYLLKDDYFIGNIEYNYYENYALYLLDSCAGYDQNLEECIITAKPIISIFDDFIKNELMMHHILPEAETVNFLKHLISSIE